MRGRLVGFVISFAVAASACSSGDGVSTTSTAEGDGVTTTTVAETDDDSTADDTAGVVDATDDSTADEVAPFEPAPVDWESFDDDVDVAVLDVPVDYADPTGDTIELFLARYRAIDQENRIGTLLVNPGGPGFGGSDFAFFASQIFDQPLLERFDILGWDPRGTGESEPAIDCIDDYDRYYNEIDATPDTDAERELLVDLAEEFAAECVDNNTEIIEVVGTNNSARDMDTIRRALVLRLQLRQRARGHLGDAVPRDGAGGGARRCVRPQRRRARVEPAADPGIRSLLGDVPGTVQRA